MRCSRGQAANAPLREAQVTAPDSQEDIRVMSQGRLQRVSPPLTSRGERNLCCAAQSGFRTSNTCQDRHKWQRRLKPTSCVPWEKFILATFIPALIISLAISTDREAGPVQHTDKRWRHVRSIWGRGRWKKRNISMFDSIIMVDLWQLGAFPVCFLVFAAQLIFFPGGCFTM